MRGNLLSVGTALCIHELAHLFAAKIAKVAIEEIRILPFGGSARMENPYRLPLKQLLAVAIAGPVANLLLATITAALRQWGFLQGEGALHFVRTNLVLFLFNLLPALPLDGGRILFAALRSLLGERKALLIGLWIGRILAGLLLLAAVFEGIQRGIWNLSFILAALFILASSRDEQYAQFKSRAQQLSDLLASDFDGRPARLYPLNASTRVHKALELLRPREPAWFMLTSNGRATGLLGAQEVLNYLINGGAPDTALENLLESQSIKFR